MQSLALALNSQIRCLVLLPLIFSYRHLTITICFLLSFEI